MNQIQSFDLKDLLNKKIPFIKEVGNWTFCEKYLCLENHKYTRPYTVKLSRITTAKQLLDWILHLNEKENKAIDISGFIELLEGITYKYFDTNLFPLFAVGNKTINWETKTVEKSND